MGNLVTEFLIPWLVISQTIPPEGILLLATSVSWINALLYALLVAFYCGYFLHASNDDGILKIICILGIIVNSVNIVNSLFIGGDYNLSQSLYIMLGIMGFGVNLGFLSTILRTRSKDKFIVVTAILGMLPFSISSFFIGLMLCRVFRDQISCDNLE